MNTLEGRYMEGNEVEQEVTQQEDTQQEAPAVAQDVALNDVSKQPTAHADNAATINLQRMREAKEKAENDLAMLQQELQKQQATDELAYGDDDLVEGKTLKKEMAAVKAQLKEYKDQSKSQADEAKLKATYNDFDSVVNTDTIQRLKQEDPDFAETIALSTGSLYSRGASTYRRIKDLGIYIEDKHEKDRERAKKNAAKPRPLTSVSPQQGDSPLSMANAFADGLTPDLKKQLWKEMQQIAKKH